MANADHYNGISTGQLILVILLLFVSCQGPKQVMDSETVHSYECQQIIAVTQHDTLSIDALKQDTFLLKSYTLEDLQITNAFGLIPDFRRYHNLKDHIEEDGESVAMLDKYIIVANRLNEGLALAELELKSVADLIDCTILKLKKYKARVNDANLYKQNRLSNWAIITGAATTVLTASILVSNDEELKAGSILDWMAVAGGLITGYLAVKSAKVDKKIWLNPQKNFIHTIWTGSNSEEIFPYSTWYLINQRYKIDGKSRSLREYIIQDWGLIQQSLEGRDGYKMEEWLLQEEALYNESMIDIRIEMLETIGVGIDQLNRALYILRTKLY